MAKTVFTSAPSVGVGMTWVNYVVSRGHAKPEVVTAGCWHSRGAWSCVRDRSWIDKGYWCGPGAWSCVRDRSWIDKGYLV